MNDIKPLLLASVLALGVALPLSGFGQATTDHSKMNMAQADPMTDGEIKKIDQDAGKVTIRHGEIKNLDMPGMTMVFTVRDKSIIAKLKPGDKVKFAAISEEGKLIVADIQLAR